MKQTNLPLRQHHVHRVAFVDIAHSCHLPLRVAHERERPHLAVRGGNGATVDITVWDDRIEVRRPGGKT